MSDETANGNIENIDDLEAFEKDFFGTKTAEVEEVAADDPEDEVPDDDDSVETDDTDTEDQDTDQGEDSEEEDEPEEPAKRNRKTAQERIKELTAEKYEAQRREVETLRRLRELEEKLATPKEEAKEPAKAPAADAPNPDATGDDGEPLYPLGEFDPAYIRALTRFTIKQETDAANKIETERREQEAIQSARAQAQEVWSGRLEEAKKDVPDLVEKITSLATTFDHLPADYGQYLVDIVQSLDNGPRILAYLADNPKEAQQIVSSGATTATLSLGRLDARLAKAPLKEKVVKVTAAPPAPQKTARGTGRAATSADTDDLAAFEKQFFRKK